jgi:cell division protease FtsH
LKKTPVRNNIGFYIVILAILIAVVYLLVAGDTSSVDVNYSEMRSLFENKQVSSFVLEDSTVKMKLNTEYKGATEARHKLYSLTIFYEDLSETINAQYADGTLTEYNYKTGIQASWWVSIIPYLLLMAGLLFLMYMMMGRSGGGAGGAVKFGKARTRVGIDEKKRVTFNDVAGAKEEKEELEEIVEFLKDPQKFIKLGARIPKGVLLVGPPGTGKTLLAKAVAGEAGVQFLSISGSDFVELYVGVGASRVRDLFEQAKKVSPAIIFIDEIDAVGRQRGTGLGGGHDEREQTLNQLLVEMDGFSTNEGVIVMAATNRADILDSALLRPGRFDRTVYVGIPDVKGREEILRVHARNKMLADDVDLASLAKGTPGFTGADLENLLNEGALLSARRGQKFITMDVLDEAILKVMVGPQKKSRIVPEKARKLTAYHEAGHAIASYWLDNTDPVHQITTIPRGPSGGMTISRPAEDKVYTSKGDMLDEIVMALGGRMAEKLFLDDISTGASGDIQQATAIARAMVTEYGMSDVLGPIKYDSSDHSVFIGRDFANTKSYSEETAAKIDEEVRRIFTEAEERCEAILLEHKDILVQVADYLLEYETMDGETFEYLCKNGTLPEQKKPEDVPAPEPIPEEIPEIGSPDAPDGEAFETEE